MRRDKEPEREETTARNESPAQLSPQARRRLNTVLILSVVVLVLLLSLVAQGGFNLSPFLSPDTASETIVLYALSTLNFLAFLTVFFVLLRNVLKLVRERRANRLGSNFKLRLVGYAIGLSLLPALLLFFFAFGLLNRSIDRWFGEPARQIVDSGKALEVGYFRKEENDLLNIARNIARTRGLATATDYADPALRRQLRQEIAEYNLSLMEIVTPDGRYIVRGEKKAEKLEADLRQAEEAARNSPAPYTGYQALADQVDNIYIIAAMRLTEAPDEQRLLILARRFPPELAQAMRNINEQHGNFHQLLDKNRRIKTIYTLLLGSVTLALVFAASWLALYVARGITVPIQALVEATDRVAHGDFGQPVKVDAEDELAMLVTSFNQMAAQLAENRERLERAASDLQQKNLQLDDRRRYIETVLESLSTGVISTDGNAGVTTINRAALSILGLDGKPDIGTPVSRLIGGEQGEEVAALCRRARRSESAQADIVYTRPDGTRVHTATGAIALRNSEGRLEGLVIVIEDLTDLIQAERAAAWSEVARRMAHEIKNPLTPIQLSAERILRNYERGPDGPGGRFGEIVREGTATIVREVSALQRMVEEFSRFARLPEARPVAASLNDVVRDAVNLYNDRLDGIRIECRLAEDLPRLYLDPEQMKRVCVNLIDNAIEALMPNGNGSSNGAPRLIEIESRYEKAIDAARLIVSDTGHGIKPADRDKLFLPKFSTRERGTGLGLAIVSHIVADHKGRIWVEDNKPRGARFIIELPVS